MSDRSKGFAIMVFTKKKLYHGGRFGSKSNGRFGSAGRSTSSRGSEATKKTLADHMYYLGSAKQASDYITMTEFIVNHIKVTFVNGGDIGEALEKLEAYDFSGDMPIPEISIKNDEAEKKAEQKNHESLL